MRAIRTYKYLGLCGILISILVSSCYTRFSCDHSNNKNLGKIDFSEEMKSWTIEADEKSVVYEGQNGRLQASIVNQVDRSPRHLKEYDICESIDVKPYTAYAYYEYPNISRTFTGENLLISIEPDIQKYGDIRAEMIFVSLSMGSMGSIKAKIPIVNAHVIKPEPPFGLLFTYKNKVNLGDNTLQDIWVYEEKNEWKDMGIYYSKKEGLVAIRSFDKVYFRKR